MSVTTDADFDITQGFHAARSAPAKSKVSRLSCMLRMERIAVADWDKTVGDFDGICQEMTAVFAQNRWPQVTLEPVLFYNGDTAAAAALVMVQPLPLKLGSVAVVKWGPALRNENDTSCKAIYAQAIDLLMQEYADKRKMLLSILSRAPRSEKSECFEYLLHRGFKAGSQFKFPNRYIVNLRLSDDVQRKSFAQKWRYHLNKSNKQGLEFVHARPEEAVKFDTLYRAMTDRKKFPDHSAYDDTISELMTTDVDALRPELFFVTKDGEAVAGAIIFKAGRTAVYLYGATNEKALPLRAGYFMHWHIIRWLRDNTKCDLYDLGGTDGFQGLHQFKKGMVGDLGLITEVPPIANYASSLRAKIFGLGAYKARDLVMELRFRLEKLRAGTAKPNQGQS